MGRYSLMIVDDEEWARRHILEDIAWSTLDISPVFSASNGREALALLRKHHPDILILDIRMPEMDGIALLEQIMQRESRYGWPQVITLSGYSDFEAARKMLSSGIVVEYLLKPASEDELFEAVYKCIERIDDRRDAFHRKEADAQEPDPVLKPDTPAVLESLEYASSPRRRTIQTVQWVKSYIQENYAQRITLDSAARLVLLNPTYLSKLFAEIEGVGFSDYLIQVRMDRAKTLLTDYRKRIYEIAGEVGYQDVKHFMKAFKKQAGMTPSEYREKYLSGF